MKTIGLLGGMSWESSLEYYRTINVGIKQALGGLHSAKIVMYSVDFDPIEKLQHNDQWEETSTILCEAAKKVERAGADFLLICTNTMHKVAPHIENEINIPLLHIADATAETILENSMRTVGLLGTAFTMEEDFYKSRLTEHFGLEVLIPSDDDRKIIHDVIYNELCLGKLLASSKREYLRIIQSLADQGAEAVILGCTEIGLLVQPGDTSIKLLDTTLIHANKAVERAILTA
ncbi:aspartate/glutamate racemase family protein [Ningiella sp. W23]|uniref:aspartate/glutamate racemase family protein n=1 Tax=Ningiella sp. W23 TaxID=3023715 RepID=UPI0037566583